jgi:hypothetical protein
MRERVRVGVLIVAGYAAIVALMLEPLMNYGAFSSAIGTGDPKLIAWTFAWTSHAILTATPLFDANIFYPAPSPLIYTEHFFGVGIFGLPIYVLTHNPVVIFSTLRIVGLTLNGVAMHVFVRRWLGSHVPAVVGGLVFSVCSTRLIYSYHVPLMWNVWIPLLLLAADRWMARREWRWMTATALLMVLQSLASWYLAVMTGVALGLFLAWRVVWAGTWGPRIATGTTRWRASILQALVALSIVGAMVGPFARPYLALSGHAEVDPSFARRYSLDLRSFVRPSEQGVAASLVSRLTKVSPRPVNFERIQFLGLLTLLLAGIGAARVVARASGRVGDDPQRSADVLWGGYFVLLGAVAIALSFGPSLEGEAPRLFDLLAKLPVLGMFRVPARFAVLVTLATAGLSALGTAQIISWIGSKGRLAVLALTPFMLVEWAVVIPPERRAQAQTIPPIYALVPMLPDVHAMVSLPTYRRTGDTWPSDADYMLYSTTHWRPVVNGYGRLEPPDFNWVIGSVNAFPSGNSASRMRALRIDVVVLHAARYRDKPRGAEIVAEALASPDFELLARMNEDYLFRVRPQR